MHRVNLHAILWAASGLRCDVFEKNTALRTIAGAVLFVTLFFSGQIGASTLFYTAKSNATGEVALNSTRNSDTATPILGDWVQAACLAANATCEIQLQCAGHSFGFDVETYINGTPKVMGGCGFPTSASAQAKANELCGGSCGYVQVDADWGSAPGIVADMNSPGYIVQNYVTGMVEQIVVPVTTTSTTSTSTTSTSTTTSTTIIETLWAGTWTGIPAAGTALVTLNFAQGWNLVGNSYDYPLDVAAVFGASTNVATVWKWVPAQSAWAFYTPKLSDGGAAYAGSKGYHVLTTIDGGEGFWVNANQPFSITVPVGAAIDVTWFQAGNLGALKQGWNLVSTGVTRSPSGFNSYVGASPPTSGVVPQNIATLWAWDSASSKWYFYAPSLEAQGGAALANYANGKGYLDFTANGKTLGPSAGFWVNRP